MGTGYTRTNTSDIQADEVVKSAPLNAELNAVVNAELPEVIISVFPTAGAPSATVPFPMNNFCSSTTQPNSPAANCGKSVFRPRLCCILDI